MSQHCDEAPEKRENNTDRRHASKNQVDDHRNDIEEEPGAAEDDRLHRVETNELIVLFQDVKDQAADERNTGERRGDIGGQSRGIWRSAWGWR